ncbi:hypothetical protein K431DRAFT_317671 [Polychaeton citri CBS 116435]|uniref:NAD(P)-binding protein n=1 Tax=Polychaeton citri CBS 116435 TaxID=1314669 RepID=A0A9P4UR20_9PEZI|nr:hypothetical protein K431DRAFT_317671 [Polychaeton citri CBS 116435]
MVQLEQVRASNSQAHVLHDLVCIFIGGTGGIGENTVKELCKRTTRPRVYIVGRSDQNGAEIVRELSDINSDCHATFIKADVSLIRNVDQVCADIMETENQINMLLLTAGYMTLRGRNETDEGLDRKMCVNFYSRMRFIANLAPMLTAASDANQLSRVITILAAGSEGEVNMEDLDLRQHFTLPSCLAHCVLMTDFMVYEFSKRYPGTSFSHSYPGTVKTGIANELTGAARLAVKLMYSVMSPWILNARESGERHFFQLTSNCYPSAKGAAGLPCPEGIGPVRGFDGNIGSGAYLLDWDGKPTGDERIVEKYKEVDLGSKVWEHTMAMLAQAEQRSRESRERTEGREASGSGQQSPDVPTPVGWRPAN